MKQNTWFIAGGAGFIGSHLILELLKSNMKVICIDNNRKNIISMNKWLYKNISSKKIKNLIIYKSDISNLNEIREIIKKYKFEILVNLAAISSIKEADKKPQKLFKTNVLGFLYLLESINHKITKKVIYASSSAVYGKFSTKKNSEKQKLFPISKYGQSKLLCEKIAETYSITKNINIIGLRFFNIYGERQIFKGSISGVIPKWINALKYNKKVIIHNNKNICRDFCYIGDVVQSIINCSIVKKNNIKSSVFNIGSGESISVFHLFNLIKKLTKSKSSFIKYSKAPIGTVIKSGALINKAKKQLNYYPKFNIISGLRNFLY